VYSSSPATVHNGLTHLPIHSSIHGERLRMESVQLRLEEMLQGRQATARQQLLKFYAEIDCLKNWEIWDWVKSDWESAASG